MRVNRLRRGLFEIPIKNVRAFVLTESPQGTVTLVDTGFESTAKDLIEILEREFGDVDRLLLTHDGPDHYGGVTTVRERFDPTVYAPADEQSLLDVLEHEPDQTFTDGDILDGNIEIVQVPGHSPCPSALLLGNHDALISGDILDGADRRGLPEGYLLPPPETYNHDHAAAERNLSKLLQYEFEAVFVFHGGHVTTDAKEKLECYLNFQNY